MTFRNLNNQDKLIEFILKNPNIITILIHKIEKIYTDNDLMNPFFLFSSFLSIFFFFFFVGGCVVLNNLIYLTHSITMHQIRFFLYTRDDVQE